MSAFRQIRFSTGLTQEAFAKLIGVAKVTVSSIEQGAIPISETVARKVFVATGATPNLHLGELIQPLGWDLKPYTSSHFDRWTKGDPLEDLTADDFVLTVWAILEGGMKERCGAKTKALLALHLHQAAIDAGVANSARGAARLTNREGVFLKVARVGCRVE